MGKTKKENQKRLRKIFAEAGRNGRGFRGIPFWGWNDDLQEVELRRQIREMAKAGLGGFFMHARRGLVTPYLGPEWMDSIRVAIDESRRCGLKAWLYDEDCWPSGTCSGRVTHGRDHFKQKYLVHEEVEPAEFRPAEHTVALFRARKGNSYSDFSRISELYHAHALQLQSDEVMIHFYYRMTDYLDVLCRDATAEFLKSTHEQYRQSVGNHFGRQIPGIFTDEPNYADFGRLVWSLELPEFFRRHRGYDITDHLPSLLWQTGDYHRVRFDFYDTVTRLFILAWTLPIFQWTQRNNIKLCGHLLHEDTLEAQVGSIGAAMPHYEYMQIPGIDHLFRGLGTAVLPKQASSVAAQLGRPRVLSEMFACSGWNVNFEELKWIAEWQFVLGVNMICQSLMLYSLRGCRKRDHPPSLHYQQPWWSHYYLLNDYFARLASVLTQGEDVAEVLVLHPITTAWSEFSPLARESVKLIDKRLSELVDFILQTHCDFHFGDELIMERHARVSRRRLVVGQRSYSLVVIPDGNNIRASTVKLLKRFIAQGGRVVFAGRVPKRIDGKPDAGAQSMAKKCIAADVGTPEGRKKLRRLLAPQITVTTGRGRDAEQILVQHRIVGDEQVFFLFNKDKERPCNAEITLPVGGTLNKFDPQTGNVSAMTASRRNGRMRLQYKFLPAESLLIVADGKAGPNRKPPRAQPQPLRKVALTGPWQIKRNDPNALVLDYARFRFNEDELSEPTPILEIQDLAVQLGGARVITLQYEFDCQLKNLAGKQFELVLEEPEQYELRVNESRMPISDAGHWQDVSFRRVDISRLVTNGRNTLELRRQFYVDPETRRKLLERTPLGTTIEAAKPEVELEAVYLIGDFGVKFAGRSAAGPSGSRWLTGTPQLTDEIARSAGRNFLTAGYPFFAGRITLTKTVQISGTPSPGGYLELPPFGAVTAEVSVNGETVGVAWKRPFVVPVGRHLRKGKNTIAITLATSLRNILGPHHHIDGELGAVGPESFSGMKSWVDRPDAPSRTFRDGYNCVNFGLSGPVTLRY